MSQPPFTKIKFTIITKADNALFFVIAAVCIVRSGKMNSDFFSIN
uniref:Uncharacterized protein n=1 Tax=Nelumbo nucifera TaxID=4432 RepID=A0A822ZQ31_NELNU|nr:TPA_asm: hypothetical protein HUJ06_003266 [Nelumbo nucifera]